MTGKVYRCTSSKVTNYYRYHILIYQYVKRKLKDIKAVINSSKLKKGGFYNGQKDIEMIRKTLFRKQKVKQRESHWKLVVNPGDRKGK